MTIEEHRDEAKYLAKSTAEKPPQKMYYDHEAISLIAYAAEQRDTSLLDTVERQTGTWLEGDNEKGVRAYLIEAVRELILQAGEKDT